MLRSSHLALTPRLTPSWLQVPSVRIQYVPLSALGLTEKMMKRTEMALRSRSTPQVHRVPPLGATTTPQQFHPTADQVS